MPDPSQITDVVKQVLTGGPADAAGQDARAQQAKLSFSAMLSAIESGCDCEACKLLREAVDIMRVRPKQVTTAYGSAHNPQT